MASGRRLAAAMAAAISAAAPSPCTRVGTTSTSAPRHRRAEDLQEIVNRRASGTGHDGDLPHEGRQRPLTARVEQPLAGKLFTELPQGQFQRADALGPDAFDDQLITAPRRINVQSAAAHDLQAVMQIEPHPHERVPPHRAADLGMVVLERQVAMARMRPGEIGDLARHPRRCRTTLRAGP